MFLRIVRLLALAALCALLAFAPEILARVGGTYQLETERRVLLRIALSTDDADAARAFYESLDAVRERYPAWHFRVQRVDVSRLAALAEPLPDVCVFPASRSFEEMGLSPDGLFLALAAGGEGRSYIMEETADRPANGGARYALPLPALSGEPLMIAVFADSPRVPEAEALLAALAGQT